MSSLIQCFAATGGSIREKTKMDITRPPLNDYLSEIRFELWRTCPNYWWKKKFYQHTVTLIITFKTNLEVTFLELSHHPLFLNSNLV